MSIVYVIPAYNEEHTIKNVINVCAEFGDVVVINDGSIDRTAEVVKTTKAKLIEHNKNRGYAAALKSGLSYVLDTYELICVIDADGEIQPDIFKKFINTSLDDTFIIGDRQTKNRFVEYLICNFLRFNFKVKDPICGGFLISGKLNKAILNRISYTELDSCFFVYKLTASRLAKNVLNVRFKPCKRIGASRFGAGLSVQFNILRAYLKAAYYAANN